MSALRSCQRDRRSYTPSVCRRSLSIRLFGTAAMYFFVYSSILPRSFSQPRITDCLKPRDVGRHSSRATHHGPYRVSQFISQDHRPQSLQRYRRWSSARQRTRGITSTCRDAGRKVFGGTPLNEGVHTKCSSFTPRGSDIPKGSGAERSGHCVLDHSELFAHLVSRGLSHS